MKNNRLQGEMVFRSIYIVLAGIALLTSLGIFTLNGSEPHFDVFFIQNYWILPLVMTLIASAFALKDCVGFSKNNLIENRVSCHPYLRFSAMTACVFGLIMGIGFVGRVGDQYLVDGLSYAAVYPGAVSLKYWTDLSVLLSRFVCPLLYIIGFYCFDERGCYKKIHSKLGIIPPTWFYLMNKIFGKIYLNHVGGAQAAMATGKYARVAAYFFYDDVYFHQKWWIILWPTIFGAGLVIMNTVCWKLAMKERK